MPVQWASSAVFAVVNTQRRALARTMAIELLARQKALEAPEVQNDAELKLTGTKDLAEAKANFEKHLKRAYQHVAYLAQPDPDGDRYLDQVTFDEEHKSALDGTIVWKALAERDKVFDSGQFSARGLVHNLRDNDYGRTLSDIRAAFYSAPRLPLLFGGDRDLQQAIYDAVSDGLVEIVNGTGEVVAVTGPTQVNLSSAGLRLAKPTQPDVEPPPPVDGSGGTHGAGSGVSPTSGGVGSTTSSGGASTGGTSGSGGTTTATAPNEQQINFSLSQNLLGNQAIADDLATTFKALYTALDEGKVSYLQTTVQLVADTDVVAALKAVLDQAGINATTKDI
jgi:hypothetical protein